MLLDISRFLAVMSTGKIRLRNEHNHHMMVLYRWIAVLPWNIPPGLSRHKSTFYYNLMCDSSKHGVRPAYELAYHFYQGWSGYSISYISTLTNILTRLAITVLLLRLHTRTLTTKRTNVILTVVLACEFSAENVFQANLYIIVCNGNNSRSCEWIQCNTSCFPGDF